MAYDLFAISTASFIVAVLTITVRFVVFAKHDHTKRTEQVAISFQFTSGLLVIANYAMTRVKINREKKNPLANASHSAIDMEVAVLAFQTIALWLVKGSYLSSFYAAKPAMHPYLRIYFMVSSVYLLLSGIAVVLTDLLWCGTDINSEHWFEQNCTPQAHTPFSFKFAMALTTDLSIFVFGIWIVKSVQRMSTNIERIAIALVFAIGLMSLAGAIVQYAVNQKLLEQLGIIATIPDAVGQEEAAATLTRLDDQFVFWRWAELLFAYAAYGLANGRIFVRILTNAFYQITGSIRSLTGSQDRGFELNDQSRSGIPTNKAMASNTSSGPSGSRQWHGSDDLEEYPLRTLSTNETEGNRGEEV